MVKLEEIIRKRTEYDDYCTKYNEKCDELQELADRQKGDISDELTKCEQDKDSLHSKMIASQKCYDETCREFINEKMSSMDPELREMFYSNQRNNFITRNWGPIIDELSKL